MNIGIFSECYKPTMNGVVISIETFREELEKKGHNIFIFAPKRKNFRDIDAHIFRFPSIELPIHSYYPIGIPFSFRINRIIPHLNLDIIHAQSIFGISRYGRRVAHRYRIPFIVTYHTFMEEYSHYSPIARNLVKRKLIQWSRDFCNSTDAVIVPTPCIKRILKKYGVKKPIYIIPTGSQIRQYRKISGATIKKQYKISRNKKILIYVGRLAQEKNIDFLLAAFRQILDKNLPAHLILVGGGPEKDRYIRTAAKLDLTSNLTFTGYLPKEKTNKLLGGSDIFVFPSMTDTQGLVINEAAACRVPAVAIKALGPADLIQNGKTGFLVRPKIEDFVKKISVLIRNEKIRKRMGKMARKLVKKKYSSSVCATKLENLYKKLYNKKTKLK